MKCKKCGGEVEFIKLVIINETYPQSHKIIYSCSACHDTYASIYSETDEDIEEE